MMFNIILLRIIITGIIPLILMKTRKKTSVSVGKMLGRLALDAMSYQQYCVQMIMLLCQASFMIITFITMNR